MPRLTRGATCWLKLDFSNFFNSIVPNDLVERISSQKLDSRSISVLTAALFWKEAGTKRLCLSIGAPSSPRISNIVMYNLDNRISSICSDCGVIFTRYADDITLSGRSIASLLEVESRIRTIVLQTVSPSLRFNDSKRGIYTRGMKRMVTGLKITPEGLVSLGRERKRAISAALHHYSLGREPSGGLEVLRGWLAFANSAEPAFLESLRRKYGGVVDNVLHRPILRQ